MAPTYQTFLKSKLHADDLHGFKPLWMPDFLKPFQTHCTDWAIRKGRCALYEDCGLGKTPQLLVVAENVVRKTNKPALILTPLAVAPQTVRDGEKFGIEVKQVRKGEFHKGINVTNYERLDYYNPKDFAIVVADESGCIKSFSGETRKRVTAFMAKVPYRLLCTATPSPNDYMELGSSAEALGVMGRNQMLGMFFTHDSDDTQQWSLKGHAAKRFWRWVCTWARALRKPSDLGFDDEGFVLPPLTVNKHLLPSPYDDKQGFFQFLGARTLHDQKKEQRKTLHQRCELAAEKIKQHGGISVAWCHLNPEGDLLEKLIPGAVQVAGADSDRVKEERFVEFAKGNIPVLVTKPKIGGWGLNWQHCNHMTWFPTWSFESYYQAVRRLWRYGQLHKVSVDMILSQGERRVLVGMLRKERQMDTMFSQLIESMGEFQLGKTCEEPIGKIEVPAWLT